MTIVSSGTLARLRKNAEATFDKTATIATPTMTKGGTGGRKAGAPTTTTASCLLAPIGRTPEERSIAARLVSESLWTISFAALTAIDAATSITIDNVTYEVVGILGPESYEVTRRVVCRKLT